MMLSKREQRDYVKSLEAQIARHCKHKSDPDSTDAFEMDTEARLLFEKGMVKEQWKNVGDKIEYVRSKIEREGWNIPGPLNIDDEEDQNIELDDLEQPRRPDGEIEHPDAKAEQYKRYFFQMNFEMHFPFEDDTIFLAYSRPYQYS